MDTTHKPAPTIPVDPNHTHCEQPVQQRTVTAVYPLGQRIHLGVELQPHDQHTETDT